MKNHSNVTLFTQLRNNECKVFQDFLIGEVWVWACLVITIN